MADKFSQSSLTRSRSGRVTSFIDGLPVAPHPQRHTMDSEVTLAGPQYREDSDSDGDDDWISTYSSQITRFHSPASSTAHLDRIDLQRKGKGKSRLHRQLSNTSHISWKRSDGKASKSGNTSKAGKAGKDPSDVEKKGQPTAPEKDPNIVDWDGPDDPENPHNMSRCRKWTITIILGFVTVCITFASSVFSTATEVTARQFNVSKEVMTLPTSLFIIGFAVGPPIWGPLSELYGRKYPLLFGYFIFAFFQIAVAVAQNLETIMICRFFGGMFGSAPLAIVGGQLADFWGPLDRGIAITIFAGATFVGPIGGPIAGEFIVKSSLGWRWTEYVTAIMGFTLWIIAFLFVPETYAPVLLSRRATKIRFETKNWAIHAVHDEQQFDAKTIVTKYFSRPFAMLIFEPILLLVTIYMSIVYGILYLSFTAFPIAFQQVRGWESGIGSLPFLGIGVGVILGGGIIIYMTKTRFKRILEREGRVVPEERLIPMAIGGFLFPAGMFWFAWTSNPNISWVPQVLAGIPIGAGILMIFLQGFNYIIDVYLMYANSAIAANTLIRCAAGAGFPLFAGIMYERLGVAWASSLLGFLAVAMFPVPILFYIYGKKIRQKSRYSPVKN